jgi:hypothetical protein
MSFANRVGCYRKASARKKKTMTSKREPLIDDDGEVRELTEADLRRMSPATEVLAPKLFADLLDMNAKARRGCQMHPPSKPPR